MSNNCAQIFECITVYVSPCDSAIRTGLIANETGVWTAQYEFNNVWTIVHLDLTAGDEIILPNDLNSNYKHQLDIYAPSGVQFDNTTFVLNVKMVLGIPGNDVTAPITVGFDGSGFVTTDVIFTVKDNSDPYNAQEIQSGNILTISMLAGKNVHIPQFLNWLPVNIPYVQASGTFDNTANGGFLNNDKLIISYEKPV
jgi:hypothetical protein